MRKPRTAKSERENSTALLTDCAKSLLDCLVENLNAANLSIPFEEFSTAQIAEILNRVVIRLLAPFILTSSSSESILSQSIQLLSELKRDSEHVGLNIPIVDIAIHHVDEMCSQTETLLSSASTFEFEDLVDTYEELLNLRLTRRDNTFKVITSEKERRTRGVFYTPPALVEELTEESLNYLLKDVVSLSQLLSLRVVDPAMGAGLFLRQVTLRLAEFSAAEFSNDLDSVSKIEVIRLIATCCLFGVDADSVAVDLAKIGLGALCKLQTFESFENFKNLRCGNSLIGDWYPNESREPKSLIPQSDLKCLKWFPGLSLKTLRCFHWKLEFADIFDNGGFDLVLTNPPWEIEKNNSREFFSKFDDQYLELGKQSANQKQEQIFGDDVSLLKEWNQHRCFYKGLKTYLHKGDVFFHQGAGDSNSYKLFLELGHKLLKPDGVLAQIVPSGIYSDKGAAPLRRLFVNENRWQKLSGFINHNALFPIHRSFKFCTLIVIKGGKTESIQASFLRVQPGLDEVLKNCFPISADQLRRLSSEHLAFSESSHVEDFAFVEKLARLNVRLSAPHKLSSEAQARITFKREFDMTNDSKLFVPRAGAVERTLSIDCFGHWLKGKWQPVEVLDAEPSDLFVLSGDFQKCIAIEDIEQVYLPLYEGRMIGQFDWAKKGWSGGTGRRAIWNDLTFSNKQILPQYLMRLTDYLELQPARGLKLTYLAVGAATNSRSLISSVIGDWPCANSVPVLDIDHDRNIFSRENFIFALAACLNSFVFDFALRMRLSSNNLNWFILQESTLPELQLLANDQRFVRLVSLLSHHPSLITDVSSTNEIFLTLSPSTRARYRAVIEAVTAAAYGVDEDDLHLILRRCEINGLKTPPLAGIQSLEKSFHRVDSNLPPLLRLPALFFDAFRLLQENGIDWLLSRVDQQNFLFDDNEYNLHCGFIRKPIPSLPANLKNDALRLVFDEIRKVGNTCATFS